ncbi:MAG: magnetosome biogenesis CDF transporter MamM [Nitrospinae bacterium]|nr:magnetosome biogenesis CDF transporter MamM [Nitrospinota bacterium]
MRYSKCVACYESIGWVGLVSNLGLAFLKLFVGIISGSHALVADSLYSAKDVITSGLIIVGLKVSRKPIDRDHPYGHGKVEFILSALVSVLFIGVTGLIFFFAAESLLEGKHSPPHLIALWTAIFSIIANVYLEKYTTCVAVEINSPMVRTLSRHHMADAMSSLAVAIGIIGSHYVGLVWLDSAVALFETLHLLYLGGEIFWDSYQGLMDSSAPAETIDRIAGTAKGADGVQTVEDLRTRRVGQELCIDIVIGVDPESSIFEAKAIANRVEERVLDEIPHVGVINVHYTSPAGSVPELAVVKSELAGGRGADAPAAG